MRSLVATLEDGNKLADLRVRAMRESLTAIGRFDPTRARERFLSDYKPEQTKMIYRGEALLGFYTLAEKTDHLHLSHLYVEPEFQGCGVGSEIIGQIKQISARVQKPIRLGALKESRSNEFYKSHGFVQTHQEEFDNYYEREAS